MDQVQEESAEPTTFEIPTDKFDEVERLRNNYESTLDLVNARIKTKQRDLERRADEIGQQFDREFESFRKPLAEEVESKLDTLQQHLATILPFNPATHVAKFSSNREVVIVPLKDEHKHTGGDDCPACKAEARGKTKGLKEFLDSLLRKAE